MASTNPKPVASPRARKAGASRTPKTLPAPHPLAQFVGEPVIIHTRGGRLIQGQLRELDLEHETLILDHCQVLGSRYHAVGIATLAVSGFGDKIDHIHTMPSAVAPVAKTNTYFTSDDEVTGKEIQENVALLLRGNHVTSPPREHGRDDHCDRSKEITDYIVDLLRSGARFADDDQPEA
jgi:small nuclear ribonucleoprotein (snRNP)-like protein